jgi:haloacetate dehalogenase
MRQLGFGQFQLVAHGVAHRLVLDHPDAVTRLAVLDIVPTRHVLGNVTRARQRRITTGSSWPPRTACPSI